MALVATVLFGALGCSTYHYFDITITAATPVTETETSSMTTGQIVVTGADSETVLVAGPGGNFPSFGTFEYATFTDSGSLTFTYNGYQQNVDPNAVCTTGSTNMTASSEITQMGAITLTSYDSTKCPPHVTP
jgi:hypothetical protein